MKKKVQIATAFSVHPNILILDEPLRGLDRSSRTEVLSMIRESANRGAMVLMASHLFTEGELQADRLLTFPIGANADGVSADGVGADGDGVIADDPNADEGTLDAKPRERKSGGA